MTRIYRDTSVTTARKILKENLPNEANAPNLLTMSRDLEIMKITSYYDIVVGTTTEVRDGFATHEIGDFVAALLDDYKVYFLAGTHTLIQSDTFGPTLTNVKMVFDPGAIITKASTFVWTFSGTKFEIFGGRFSGFVTSDILVSGAQCWFRVVDGALGVFDVTGTGSKVESVNSGIRWDLIYLDTTGGEIQLDGTEGATSTSTGTLRIPNGGLGIGLDLWVGLGVNIDGGDVSFTGADADRVINFASDASLNWDETGGWGADGDLTFNKQVGINIDAGSLPTITAETGLVVSNTSLAGDNSAMAIISGNTGTSLINLGDTDLGNIGQIQYVNNGDYFRFLVNSDIVVAFNDSTTGTILLHDDVDQDGGIAFASDANILWDETGGFATVGNFNINKPVNITLDGGTLPSILADTGLIVTNSSNTADLVSMALISGATGSATLYFGDTTTTRGAIQYDHDPTEYLNLTVGLNGSLRIASSATETLRLNYAVDADSGIAWASDASLTWDETGGFATVGNFNINKPINVNLDAGSLPTISADTAIVASNTSLTGDNTRISIISGNTGSGNIDFGDTDSQTPGIITYSHSLHYLSFWVNADRVVDFNASTTATIDIHTDANQDGGIAFASDANLLWVEASDRFEYNKPLHFLPGSSLGVDVEAVKIEGVESVSNSFKALTFRNTKAAAVSNEIEFDFNLDRTTGGETVFARMIAGATDVGNTTADGDLTFQVSVNAVLATKLVVGDLGTTYHDDILVNTNNVHDIGKSGMMFANMWATTFHGTATQAQYADLAEIYTIEDGEQPEGTLVSISDGMMDVKPTNKLLDKTILGVVSLKPGYLMNSDGEGQPIARIGMIPIRVLGAVNKGDFLVSSFLKGVARKGQLTEIDYKFAYAIETNLSEGEKLVQCII